MTVLRDEILPQERHGDFGQTEWAEGWRGIFSGFGYAAALLTKHRGELGATIDQAGLALFFLQRHRVELGLKVILDAAGGRVPNNHHTTVLWEKCRHAVSALDRSRWEQFEAGQRSFVELFRETDENSYTFRYPVDTRGQKVVRPDFIDFDALERHADDFNWSVLALRDALIARRGA